jgi:hypothetical protein
MHALRAALAHFPVRLEHTVHRPRTAHECPLVEQRRMHLRGCLVDESRLVQVREHLRGFTRVQRAG